VNGSWPLSDHVLPATERIDKLKEEDIIMVGGADTAWSPPPPPADIAWNPPPPAADTAWSPPPTGADTAWSPPPTGADTSWSSSPPQAENTTMKTDILSDSQLTIFKVGPDNNVEKVEDMASFEEWGGEDETKFKYVILHKLPNGEVVNLENLKTYSLADIGKALVLEDFLETRWHCRSLIILCTDFHQFRPKTCPLEGLLFCFLRNIPNGY
jgi:hypothetical protein